MRRNLSELHQLTDWYRLLLGDSGKACSFVPAYLQKSSVMKRSMLRAHGSVTIG